MDRSAGPDAIVGEVHFPATALIGIRKGPTNPASNTQPTKRPTVFGFEIPS
jgi:hypothetical protein